MMWIGSSFQYDGRNCTFTGEFDLSLKDTERVDTALSWFNQPKTPANLVMLYIEQPDELGHVYGHESPIVSYGYYSFR